MTGEYTRDGKTIQFPLTIEPGKSPPPTVTLRSRACPKSPLLEIMLSYLVTDTRRDVAIYAITVETPVG